MKSANSASLCVRNETASQEKWKKIQSKKWYNTDNWAVMAGIKPKLTSGISLRPFHWGRSPRCKGLWDSPSVSFSFGFTSSLWETNRRTMKCNTNFNITVIKWFSILFGNLVNQHIRIKPHFDVWYFLKNHEILKNQISADIYGPGSLRVCKEPKVEIIEQGKVYGFAHSV